MADGRWSGRSWLGAAAALAMWSLTVGAVRHAMRAERPSRHARGVASAAERRAVHSKPDARVEAGYEAAWRDWVLRSDGVPLRDVTFHVVADEEFRERIGSGWRADVRDRMARASAVFEREFRIRLVVASVGEWVSADGAATIHELHAGLARETAGAGTDAVIAFTSQHARHHSSFEPAAYDRGVAYYFGRWCIVRTGMPSGAGAWPYENETVLHEIGHLFGAWHSTDRRSVMRAVKWGSESSSFDLYARTAILAARDLDFRRGTDSVDDAAVDALFAAWTARHASDADFPPWQALCTEGWWAQRGERTETAVRCCDRALALDRRFGPFTRSPDFEELVAFAEARRPR